MRHETTQRLTGRVLGLDLGARRIGVAVSDDRCFLATGHGVLARSGDREADRSAIAGVVAELGAVAVIVGLPLSLSGEVGPAAAAALAEANALGEFLAVPVMTHDERFTTVTAMEGLRGGGGRRQARRRRVDEAAATVMLQSWLDTQAATAGRGLP